MLAGDLEVPGARLTAEMQQSRRFATGLGLALK